MQHLDIRVGRTTYLLCDPQTAASGKSAAYGAFLRSVDQAVRYAAALDAVLFLIRPEQPLNHAIFDLDSPDVRIVGQDSRQAYVLRALWWLTTPVRYGTPLSWFASWAALPVRTVVEAAKQWARRHGLRAIDRALDRLGHRLRGVSHDYERRAANTWRRLCAEGRARARATDSKRHQVRLRLRPPAQETVDRLAREAGIDSARPLVLLHVRESGYRQRPAMRQQRLDGLRDARVETYRAAIAWLVERGYQVVRIGDSSMTPCQMPGVVDLATASWRTDAFELWAASNSRFFICCDSGPYLLAPFFRVPALSVNVFRIGYNTIGSKDLYIVKRVYDRVLGRYLSLAEHFDETFLLQPLDVDRYEWRDNTPEEILLAVQDMVAQLDDRDRPRTAAQTRHDQLLASVAKQSQPIADASRLLLFRRGGRGTISPRFAAQYFDFAPSPSLEPDPGLR